MSVLPMTALFVAVVETKIVAALQAIPAIAAAAVRDRTDARAWFPTEGTRARRGFHDSRRPFVSGDKRKRRRPESGKVAVDNVRVGAADERRIDFAKHFVGFERR